MNNNQTQSNDATQAKTSKPKSFEMYKNENGDTEITFNLPVKFFTGLNVTEEQARGQIRNEIWLALGRLAEEITSRSYLLLMQDYDDRLAVMHHAESLSLYGQYIRGYAELLDELEVHEKYETKAFADRFKDLAENSPLDLSDMCKDFLRTNDTPEVSQNEATGAATVPKTVSENQDSARATVARWLSEQVKSPNKAVQKLVGDLLTELETESLQNTPEYIEAVLKREAELSEAKGEPTEKGENIVNALCNLATDNEVSGDKTSRNFVIVADQILNPVIKKTSETDLRDLAAKISEIMHNPLLPENIYNVIADEIADSTKADVHTPDNVLHNLKILRDSQ